MVLAAIDDRMVAQQASYSHPMPMALKKRFWACAGQQTTLAAVGRLTPQLARRSARRCSACLKQTGIDAEQITAIGCHGQTVWHEPEGDAFSMQLGYNNRIAALTNITTVGDFRRATWPTVGSRWCRRFIRRCWGSRRAAHGAERRRHR